MLKVAAGKSTMITLTVNGPAVPLNSMQTTTLDQSVTINGIAMCKWLISDPVMGIPLSKIKKLSMITVTVVIHLHGG